MADIYSKEFRSSIMSKVASKNTSLELLVFEQLRERSVDFEKHVKVFNCTPDIVFSDIKLAIFLDGDFWHGYGAKAWLHKLPQYWQLKIKKNMRRDSNNFRRLRRHGWTVLRLWGHEIKKNPSEVAMLIHDLVIALQVLQKNI